MSVQGDSIAGFYNRYDSGVAYIQDISFIGEQTIFDRSLSHSENDHKSRLIEWCQKSKRTIKFATEADGENNPSHPLFVSRVLIDDMRLGVGRGSTKKEAEQNAAQNAWVLLGDEMGDFILERYDHLNNESH